MSQTASPAASSAAQQTTPGGVLHRRVTPFEVHLDVFSGPFELLLGLISKHKLDITEISLAAVTDEFVAHLKAAHTIDATSGEQTDSWDLSQASEFVLIAATLLDLKASRLLPRTGDEPEEDLELIEARDLLFARLLQYRAFKEVAASFSERMDTQGRIWPRDVGVEAHFAALLPELVMNVTGEQLAMAAARALTPTPKPTVGLEHLHTTTVSVSEQSLLLLSRLQRLEQSTFAEMIADAGSRTVVVARFLALLELFRDGAISFTQTEAMAPLLLRFVPPSGRSSASVIEAESRDGAPSEFDEEVPAPESEESADEPRD